MERTVFIEGLGDVVLRRSERARHYGWRFKEGRIYAVIPRFGNERVMIDLTRRELSKLQKKLAVCRTPEKIIFDENAEFKTFTFKLRVLRTERANFYISLKDGILNIACPADTVFSDDNVQQFIRHTLKRAMRYEAKRVLPARTERLAKQHGFRYATVRIHDTSSRWGSCSAKKNINLSLSLMLLPEHLIDYVILHELCHTVEMNHGERFWRLMDNVTDCRAAVFRRELRRISLRERRLF